MFLTISVESHHLVQSKWNHLVGVLFNHNNLSIQNTFVSVYMALYDIHKLLVYLRIVHSVPRK